MDRSTIPSRARGNHQNKNQAVPIATSSHHSQYLHSSHPPSTSDISAEMSQDVPSSGIAADQADHDRDCILVDKDPLSLTEDGIKKKLSMPDVTPRQSSDVARRPSTLRKRPSISPGLSSFFTPPKNRFVRRGSTQSPVSAQGEDSPAQPRRLRRPSLPPTSFSVPRPDSRSVSPTVSRPMNSAIEAIANWLTVKPPSPGAGMHIDSGKPATAPISVAAGARPDSEAEVVEPIPAMVRFPPRDENEIVPSPHCVDCAHSAQKCAHGEIEWIELGREETGDGEERLDVGIESGKNSSFPRASDETERDVEILRVESSASLTTLINVEDQVSPMPISSRRPSTFTSRHNSAVNLAALPEQQEVLFSSPEESPTDEVDPGVPAPPNPRTTAAIDIPARAGDVETPAKSAGYHSAGSVPSDASQRVWLCSPPPRSPLSPLNLGASANTNSRMEVPQPMQMTRSKSEAAVMDAIPKDVPGLPIGPPSSFSGARSKSIKRNRPFVVRCISTGRLATEFDEQGRVICLSAHSERVLGKGVSTDPITWRIKPGSGSVPPTPTSPTTPTQSHGHGHGHGRPGYARAAHSVRDSHGKSRFGLPGTMPPVPRRANSVQHEGSEALMGGVGSASEFGTIELRRSSLDGRRSDAGQGHAARRGSESNIPRSKSVKARGGNAGWLGSVRGVKA